MRKRGKMLRQQLTNYPNKLKHQKRRSEEIGLHKFEAKTFKQYIYESDIEREFIFAFIAITNEDLKPDGEEVEDGKYWTMEEIKQNLGKGIFTPNFEHEFAFLKETV